MATPASADDSSGGAVAPADASVETNTGGSVAPAPEPAPTPAPRATPHAAPTPAAAPTSSPSTYSAPASSPAPVAHAAGNAVEPEAGGDQPSTTDESPPLEPLPPTSGTTSTTKSEATSSGPSLAMTGGALITTLTLGLGFLAAGIAGTAAARRRRTLSA